MNLSHRFIPNPKSPNLLKEDENPKHKNECARIEGEV